MDSSTTKNETLEQTDTCDHSENDSSVTDNIQSLWHELRELNFLHLRLAALEVQQAGNSLVVMIIAGVMVAILLSVAWLGFLAAVLLVLSRYEILTDNIALVSLAVALNLLLVLILAGVIRSKSYYLRLPATLRSLKSMSSAYTEKT